MYTSLHVVALIIKARRARDKNLLLLRVCVCTGVKSLLPSFQIYTKNVIHTICMQLVFRKISSIVLNVADFELAIGKPSLQRKSALHSYFLPFPSDKRLRVYYMHMVK